MASKSVTDVGTFVTVDPRQYVTFNETKSESTLTVNNGSPTKNIVFKVRTTQPLLFVVKPNSGIIEAG